MIGQQAPLPYDIDRGGPGWQSDRNRIIGAVICLVGAVLIAGAVITAVSAPDGRWPQIASLAGFGALFVLLGLPVRTGRRPVSRLAGSPEEALRLIQAQLAAR